MIGTLVPNSNNRVDQRTVSREIKRQSELRPDHPAVVSTGYGPLSYRELQYLINEIRSDLRAAGVSRSARIAIALPNGPHAALAIIAVACSSVAVPINPKQTLDEIEACLSVLRPDAVLLLQGSDSAVRRMAERKGLAIIEAIPAGQGPLGLKVVVPQVHAALPNDEPDPDAPAFILQTSGTTSEPKLIPFSHRNMRAAAARLQAWFNLTPQDCCLSVSPVYYSHGLKVTIFTPLLTGGTIAFPANASKFDYSEWFGALRPTWYSAGPTLHRLIFDQTKFRADTKTGQSMRFILSGGAPLPQDVQEGLQHALGVPVVEHYGSSEAAQISANLPPPGRSKLGTCGIPWPDTVIIADENGRQLPPGEQGEILVRGPTVMSGYLDAPELNRDTFVDGWLKTGDIGSLDDEGFLTLHGRQKELINRGGEKVWPIEIDNALMLHPAVAEAAAFAVPHLRLGEDVAAAVTLRPGMTATPVQLRTYLSERLMSFKVPRRISIVDRLPKGMTGKVLRRQISDSLGTAIAAPPAAPNTSNNSNLLSQLTELWERLLKTAPITIDDDFFEKGGDSLLAEELLIEVERLIGQTVPSSILFEAATIRQLAQKLSEESGLQHKPLIQMNSNGSQTPLFHFWSGSYAGRIANLLGSDQPFFVVAATPFPRSLEEMAAQSFPLIINAHPQGPYRLCGLCAGGLVAFEVARMLLATGRKVEMVCMIDPPTTNARRSVQTILSILDRIQPFNSPFADRVFVWTWLRILGIDNSSTSQWLDWVMAKPRSVARRVLRLIKQQVTDPANEKDPATNSEPLNSSDIAMARYFPKPLSVPVIHFSAEYDAKAWRRISPDLEVIKLSGGHLGVFEDPGELVDKLKAILNR